MSEVDFALEHIDKAIEELQLAEIWLREIGYEQLSASCAGMWNRLQQIEKSLKDDA